VSPNPNAQALAEAEKYKHWTSKADLTVNDILLEGGFLNAEQTKQLFFLLIKESRFLPMIDTISFDPNEWELSKLGFEGRVVRAATEDVALPEADRSRPDLGQSVITVNEFIAETRIPYSALEDHVTNGSLINHIKTEFSKAISRDSEAIAINGDTSNTGTTPFDGALKKSDGFHKRVVSSVYAAGGVRFTKAQTKVMAQIMADEHYRDGSDMVFFTNKNAAIDYGQHHAARVNEDPSKKLVRIAWDGVDIVKIPEWPSGLGVGLDETTVILCDPKNATMGFQRKVTMETDKDISARKWIVVVTYKSGQNWKHEPATVKATGIIASPGL
jgi:hypothetical protein